MAEILASLSRSEVVDRLRRKVEPFRRHLQPFNWAGNLTSEFGPPLVRPDGTKQWIFRDMVCTVTARGYSRALMPAGFKGTVVQFADHVWEVGRT